MSSVSITIEAAEADQRIDKILAERFPEQSRAYFQRLILNEDVLLEGQAVMKRERPHLGQVVSIRFALTPEISLTPEAIPLDILFEDQYLLAVNKPSGMVVHPAPGNWSGTFVNALLYHCKGLLTDHQNARPGIVHRLDKFTSGILLAAKTSESHYALSRLFSERNIEKEYLAICIGNPGSGDISAPIGRHPVNRKKRAVLEQGGQNALTRFTTLRTNGPLSLVEVQLLTGRTHQIRVHMQYRGFPILGDPVYGSDKMNAKYGVERQMLHAHRLSFIHPFTQAAINLQAEPPEDFQKLLQHL